MSPAISNPQKPQQAGYKRIIVCCDGTWLSSNTGVTGVPSNVSKLARSIANNGLDAEGRVVNQIVYYHSGLGTGDLPLQKAIYGGLGIGLDLDVCQIYDFICNNYCAGDEIFLFGFSRGAFTVRSAASIVCDVGIMSAAFLSRFPDLWKAYMNNVNGDPFTKSTWYLDNKRELGLRPVTIKVVGVWDTVGALGIPEWPGVRLLQKLGVPINKEFAFHDTQVSTNLEYAFQALAIDEKRLTFPPTLWHKSAGGPSKKLEQCWFPGVHGGIGGQAEMDRSKGDHEEMGYITFAWMVDNLSELLSFRETTINSIIDGHQRALNTIGISNGWGCGPIVDDFYGVVGAFFRLLGRMDRTPGGYPRDPGDGTEGSTNEFFHPVVRMRQAKVPNYRPPPLHGFCCDAAVDASGWIWQKKGLRDMPEYVLNAQKVMSIAYEEDGIVKFRSEEALSRRLCPKNILKDLDRDNM